MQTQLSLFAPINKFSVAQKTSLIKGLTIIEDFITSTEEKTLLHLVDNEIWINDLKRRVQHYGYRYDYKSRRINSTMRLGSMPIWLNNLCTRLADDGFFKFVPDQVIVNEYQPGQGITPHIDCEPCFDDTIISLSLNASVVMEFSKDNNKIPLLLPPRSIIVLKEEARYDWKHGIPMRLKDNYEGETIIRKRRVSLTFRKVIT